MEKPILDPSTVDSEDEGEGLELLDFLKDEKLSASVDLNLSVFLKDGPEKSASSSSKKPSSSISSGKKRSGGTGSGSTKGRKPQREKENEKERSKPVRSKDGGGASLDGRADGSDGSEDEEMPWEALFRKASVKKIQVNRAQAKNSKEHDEVLQIIQQGKGNELTEEKLQENYKSLGMAQLLEEAMKCHADIETIKKLINLLLKNNDTVQRSTLSLAVTSGQSCEIVELLLKEGKADPNGKPKEYEFNILHDAVVNQDEEVIQILLKCGALPNADDVSGNTPLHLASKYSNPSIAQILLNYKADVNSANNMGTTPLHVAAKHDKSAIVDLLLVNGANANTRDMDGWTPMFLAFSFGSGTCMRSLQEKTKVSLADADKKWPIHYVVERNDKLLIQFMLDHTMDINVKSGVEERTPLDVAIQMGERELVHFLLDRRANPNLQSGPDLDTPLFLAAKSGQADLIELLLASGAEVDKKNKHGWSPLYIACETGDTITIKTLLDNGANVNIQNLDGWTPLRLAVRRGHVLATSLLIERGADPNIVDFFYKKTALWPACVNPDMPEEASVQIVKMLLSAGIDPNKKSVQGLTAFQELFYFNYMRSSKIIELLAPKCDPKIGSPLPRVVEAIVEAQNKLNSSTSHVDISSSKAAFRHFLKAAKYLINKDENDAILQEPMGSTSSMTVLEFIVQHEIGVLIAHEKVQRVLEHTWGYQYTDHDSPIDIAIKAVRSRRMYFYASSCWYFLFLLFFTWGVLEGTSRNDVYSFYFTQAIEEQLIGEEFPLSGTDTEVFKNYNDIETADEFWEWANGPFTQFITSEGSVFNGHDTILSTINMRQLRVKREDCDVNESFQNISGGCYATFSSSSESTDSYGPNQRFVYTPPESGKFLSFAGSWYHIDGGFVQQFNISNMNQSEISDIILGLQNDDWIDASTSAVISELIIYNANLDRFCVARTVVEFTNSGRVVGTYNFNTVWLKHYISASEIIFLIIFLAFVAEEIREMKNEKKSYWSKSKGTWNFIDLFIYLLIIAWIVVRSVVLYYMDSLEYNPGETPYYKYQVIVDWKQQELNVVSIIAIFAYGKILKYARIFPRVGVLIRIMGSMFSQVALFMIVFVVAVTGFALSFHIIFGNTISTFRTWHLSILALFRIVTGDFDWLEIEKANRFLGSFIFFLYIALGAVLLLNLLIAMLNQSYQEIIERARSEYLVERAGLILSYSQPFSKERKPELVMEIITDGTEKVSRNIFMKNPFKKYDEEKKPLLQEPPPAPPSPASERRPTTEDITVFEDDLHKVHLCNLCLGVDGHLTTCKKFKRAFTKSMAEHTKKGVAAIKERVSNTKKEASPSSGLSEETVEAIAKMMKEQQTQLMQFITSQQDKLKEVLKEDLKTELDRDMQLQTEKLLLNQRDKLEELAERLERRLPQSEFDYVYA